MNTEKLAYIQRISRNNFGTRVSNLANVFWTTPTLIANISGTDQVVDKWKAAFSTAIPLTFDEKCDGPLKHRAYAANVYPPKINSARDFRQLSTSIANISSRGLGVNFLPAKGFKSAPPLCRNDYLIAIVG